MGSALLVHHPAHLEPCALQLECAPHTHLPPQMNVVLLLMTMLLFLLLLLMVLPLQRPSVLCSAPCCAHPPLDLRLMVSRQEAEVAQGAHLAHIVGRRGGS